MSRRWQAAILIMATLGCLVMLPVGAVGAIASPIVFDDPHNLERPLAWMAFLLALGLWIVCIVAPFGAWVAFAKRREQLQWIAIGSPFVWFLATGLTFFAAKV
jgi:hypothetical protein